jgi:hypothetical protein
MVPDQESTSTNSATPSAVQVSCWGASAVGIASPSAQRVVGGGEVEAVDQHQAEPVEQDDGGQDYRVGVIR